MACDMPHANRLTLHLMAAMAEHERAMISERTRVALAAAKARGVKLGNPNGAEHLVPGCRDAAAKAAARRKQADLRARAVQPLLARLAAEGVVSASEKALKLNQGGVPAPRGGTWCPRQVRRTCASNAS